jgi:hypothetical protein
MCAGERSIRLEKSKALFRPAKVASFIEGPGLMPSRLLCFDELLEDWQDVPNSWFSVGRESFVHKWDNSIRLLVYTYLEDFMDNSYHFPLVAVNLVR